MNVLEKILEEIKDNAKLGNMRWESIRIEKVEEIIRSHMDEAENGGWIPVSKRLPEDGETVLCTDGEDIFLVEYEASLDVGFGDMDWITAWQPLPEPYVRRRK